jgi:pimeloyl-ACP methyl ester carboxylesterase
MKKAFPPLPDAQATGWARNREVELAWRAYGQGEPLFLIMGFLASADTWFRFLRHLPLDRYRAIAFDNRGSGASSKPLGLWSMDDLVADAVTVLDAAGIENAHVLGASMGGMIAQHLALAHPERVRSLILACTEPVHRFQLPPWRLVAGIALRPALGGGFAEKVSRPILYARGGAHAGSEKLDEDARLRDQDGMPILAALGQASAIFRHDAAERLEEIEAPTLILHGAEDTLIPPAQVIELKRRIPHAELELLPHAGHMVITDAEEPTARAIVRFLDRQGEGSSATL